MKKEHTAISISNVSKKYKLFDKPGHRLHEALHPFKRKYHREFWALRDISFDVRAGQTLGIIGRNGSGKSTLLQVLAGVTAATTGSVAVRGRLAALLELGAGFNPEFSGRENVFFYGQLMGCSPVEMKQKLPLIEQFAEIGDFFDQPVKIYSSGMFIRLAFAAAIHVDPDILIVDEALAVGDVKFQQKCYQKFIDFQEAGKTILLVTHDVNAIVRHCDAALLLDGGTILEKGEPSAVVNRYLDILFTDHAVKKALRSEAVSYEEESPKNLLEFMEESSSHDRCSTRKNYNKNEYRYGNRQVEIIDYLIVKNGYEDVLTVNSKDSIEIYVKIKAHRKINQFMTGFGIKTVDGVEIYGINTRNLGIASEPLEAGAVRVFKWTVGLDLAEGDFFIDLGCADYAEGAHVPLDRRYAIAHLRVHSAAPSAGLVKLDVEFEKCEGLTLSK